MCRRPARGRRRTSPRVAASPSLTATRRCPAHGAAGPRAPSTSPPSASSSATTNQRPSSARGAALSWRRRATRSAARHRSCLLDSPIDDIAPVRRPAPRRRGRATTCAPSPSGGREARPRPRSRRPPSRRASCGSPRPRATACRGGPASTRPRARSWACSRAAAPPAPRSDGYDVDTRVDAFSTSSQQALAEGTLSHAIRTRRRRRKAPSTVGANCSAGSDCAAGACVAYGGAQYCTRVCSRDRPLPDRLPVHGHQRGQSTTSCVAGVTRLPLHLAPPMRRNGFRARPSTTSLFGRASASSPAPRSHPTRSAGTRRSASRRSSSPSSPAMGLLGIRIPEEYGGSGIDTTSYAICVEEIARVDGSHRPDRRVAQRPGDGPRPCASAARTSERRYLPEGGDGRVARGVGAHRAGQRERLGRPSHDGAPRRQRLGHQRHQDVHHSGLASAASASFSPAPTPMSPSSAALPRSSWSTAPPGFTASKHLLKLGCRVERHGGAHARGRARPRRAARGRGRPGLHRHDADPRPRAHLDRRDGARPRLRRARHGGALRQGAPGLRQGHRRLPGHPVDAGRPKTELDAAALLTYRAAWLADQGRRHSHEAAMAKLFASEAATRACNAPCRSTAATATCASSTSSATCATRSSARSAKAPARCSAWSSPSTSCDADIPRAHSLSTRVTARGAAVPPVRALRSSRPLTSSISAGAELGYASRTRGDVAVRQRQEPRRLLTRWIVLRIHANARGKNDESCHLSIELGRLGRGKSWQEVPSHGPASRSEGASMFRGRYEHTIDAKGRTSLPARYRDALAPAGERRIVLTSALDPCLVAYATPEWMAFEEKIAKLPAVRSRRAEAPAHLRVGRGRVRVRRLGPHPRPSDAARSRGAEQGRPLGRRGATPSSGTRRPGSATSRRPTTSSARSRAPRGARAMSELAARSARRARPTASIEWVWREDRRGERREALRARDGDEGRGRRRARSARTAASTWTRRSAAVVTRWRSSRPRRRRASSASTAIRPRIARRRGALASGRRSRASSCARLRHVQAQLDALGVGARRRSRARTSA